MVMLDVVIGVHVLAELPLTGLHFLISGFFFRSKISAVPNDVFKAGEHLVPVQLYISTAGLLQTDTLAAAVSPALSRYSMRMTAYSVLVL